MSTQPSEFCKREYAIGWLILISVVILLIGYHCPPYLNDDSFITLTYVKNLVRGNGFVFNHPPPVLGTTTPLFTLLTAALTFLLHSVSPVKVAIYFSAFCWLGIAWLFFLFRKAWQLTYWQVCIIAGAILIWGWISLLGMEAFLFAFLLILSASLLLSEQFTLAGFTTALLFLTRGEGILMLGVLALSVLARSWQAREKDRSAWLKPLFKLGIGFAIPTAAWILYATATFGSFLPNTLAAKQAQGQTTFGKRFLAQLFHVWVPAWTEVYSLKGLPHVNLWWLAIGIGTISVFTQRRRWLLLLGWISAYITGYTLLGVSTYGWYQVPILFILDIVFALGLITLVEFITARMPLPYSRVIATILLGLFAFTVGRPAFTYTRSYHGDSRAESYLSLAKWFREHTQPSESIAYIEVGYLGYYTDNRIIDLAGLILPDILPHIAEGDFAWGFWKYEPDYYVYLPAFDWALRDIRLDPRFEQEYRAIATLPGPRTTDFVIYQHVDPSSSSVEGTQRGMPTRVHKDDKGDPVSIKVTRE